jgi:hypothetical protein
MNADRADEAGPGYLEHHRCRIPNVFAEGKRWDDEATLSKLMPSGRGRTSRDEN